MIVREILKRFLVISTPAVFMRVSMAKYNLERNLRVLYDHRRTVLSQYETFESAIGDDIDAKNQFRLEIAKVVFSDPTTGYVDDSKSNSISINPLVGTVERIAK